MTSSVLWRPWPTTKGDAKVQIVKPVPIEQLTSRSTSTHPSGPGKGMKETMSRTTQTVPNTIPTSTFLPVKIGDTTITRHTPVPLRALASQPVPRPISSTTPARLPGIKLTISTLRPFRVTKINPSPTQPPRIPSEFSDFEVYNPRNGDVWGIVPPKLHLVRKRSPMLSWASLTPVTNKDEDKVKE